MTIVHQNIAKLFKASGMTQKDFAEKFGISAKVAWTYINGTAKPGGQFLLRLCEFYSIDFEFLNNTRIRINARGEIENRPNYKARAQKIRRQMDQLMTERQQFERVFQAHIAKLAMDLESIASMRR